MQQPTTRTSGVFRARPSGHSYQRGVSLIELLVGIAIGLLVVAVAGGALMASRGISGTVSDASVLQQQAGFAFRVIGQQVRQAGSLYLNLDPANHTGSEVDRYALPVAFETRAASTEAGHGFSPRDDTISGTDSSLTVGYRRYSEAVFNPRNDAYPNESLSRNCVGGPANGDTYLRVESRFTLQDGNLRCGGNNTATAPQPIVGNVANFRVRYLLTTGTGDGNPQIQYVNAATAGSDWSRVAGVEVCLVLYGSESIDMPSGSNYTDCDGSTSVDMSSAASLDMGGNAIGSARARRMHVVFRNIYQLRSQGLIGSAL